jgi:hypothetical protein
MLNEKFNGTVGKTQTCDENQVYDVFHRKCRALACPDGFTIAENTCVPSNDTTIAFEDALTSCPMIKLSASEFTILSESVIYVNSSGEELSQGAFFLQEDGSALVCTNFTREYLNETIPMKFSSAQTIVSVVGQIISIIFLSVHLIVYSMFRKLRNLAGLCIMSLSATLLVAQLLFLLAGSASGNYPACATIAILVHYFFMAAFMWMNVMAFDICRTFTKFSKPSSSDNYMRKFVRFCLYSLCTSLLIVLIAVVVNYSVNDSVYRPGYGEGVCWFKYRRALLIFFAVPVAMVILANIVYFGVTLYSIQKATKLAMMATTNNKKSDRDRFWLYVKLSTIMGLTWVFGFVAAIFDVAALWYLFLIFNSLQGAMICVSFVFTKQVIGFLKEKFLKTPYSESEMATRSTGISQSKSSSDPASSKLLQQRNR